MRLSASFLRRASCLFLLTALPIVWFASNVARADVVANGDVDPNPVTSGAAVEIGRDGVGTLTINGGSNLQSYQATIGRDWSGIGFATVTGPGSSWIANTGQWAILVGQEGIGRLDIHDQGLVDASESVVVAGAYGGSSGTIAMDGVGTILRAEQATIGLGGYGRLEIGGGAILNIGDRLDVGYHDYGNGTIVVAGAGSMLRIQQDVSVGFNGSGRLEVHDGAFLDAGFAGSGDFNVAGNGDGQGTVIVDGENSIARIAGQLSIGSEGTGLVSVGNGALLDAQVSTTTVGTHGKIELDGGLMRAYALDNRGTISGGGTIELASQQRFVDNRGSIEVGTGERLAFVSNGGSFQSVGTITVSGGELDFSDAGYSDSTGQIELRDGVVRAPAGEGLRCHGVMNVLDGTNEIYGGFSLHYAGTMVVTNNSALLFHSQVELDGDLVVHSGSTVTFLNGGSKYGGILSLIIDDEGSTVPIQTIGETQIEPERLQVSFAQSCNPQVGNIFPLVTGTDIRSEFNETELPTLPFGMVWSLDESMSSIQLRILATPDGDYNGDGTVDAADYTVWRGALGSSTLLSADGDGNGLVDDGDYALWKSNFGADAWSMDDDAVAQAALAAVPEPAAGVLLLVGAVLLARRRR